MKAFFFYSLFITSLFNVAYAEEKKPQNLNTPIKSQLVYDLNQKKILFSRDSYKKIYPASLTKVMTLYIIFYKLKKGHIKMETEFIVSRNASLKEPCKIFLKEGEKITVKDLINSLIVKSANDSATTIAENISKTESRFALLMNKYAKKLKMYDTNFKNASGLPNDNQYSTARDLAKLALAIKRDFPEYYPLFSKKSFSYKGKNYFASCRVINEYAGAEGLKTGYISASGHQLISIAKRGKFHLMAIVLGSDSTIQRDDNMIKILDKYFVKLDANRKTFISTRNITKGGSK